MDETGKEYGRRRKGTKSTKRANKWKDGMKERDEGKGDK
jgi:hypothetical protein